MDDNGVEFLYRFTEEERAVIGRRFAEYAAAVRIVAELHGLDRLGMPLNTDPQNIGFLKPEGVEIRKGEGGK
jgi:hypothetical protein